MLNLKQLRREYQYQPFSRDDLAPNPFDQFVKWFEEAKRVGVMEPNAMVLATATAEGKPSTRTVLLKGVENGGFIFFTNIESRKAKEIGQNPLVSVTFLWLEMTRQITIEGIAELVSKEETSGYFASRPRGSQLGSSASRQDQIIESREILEKRYQELEKKYEGKSIPPPEYWGGYRIIPSRFEFWQGQENRLHDRFQYVLDEGVWQIDRLSP
ncbi:MAG: pyridoxamine 5'-phosphate oxidase [Parachlamydiaceae bacterium]|nr:pyridoxamine 5'-phosphate oxidase [Parachlamydiaceae bacterium]